MCSLFGSNYNLLWRSDNVIATHTLGNKQAGAAALLRGASGRTLLFHIAFCHLSEVRQLAAAGAASAHQAHQLLPAAV